MAAFKRYNDKSKLRKQLSNRGAPNVISESDIQFIEKSCRIVADTISLIEKYIKPGIKTIEIDKIAEDYILSCGAKPAFKGYRLTIKFSRIASAFQ